MTGEPGTSTPDTSDPSVPILPGAGGSDYERYLRTDELLALQKPPENRVHRDELLFTTVHQTSELWLKLADSEVTEATRLIDGDDLLEAARLLRRGLLCMQFVTAQLDMLDQMDTWDYQLIRVALGHGSGFDSPGFRRLSRATPALGAAFDRALQRAGIELTQLYRNRAQHQPLYEVAEALTDWDERVRIWRLRHYTVVARAIGEETVGIQGTPVQALGKLIGQRQLPKLWEARTKLVQQFDAERERSAEGGRPPGQR
jgi:tryptophan 2,3-dioxygenase